MTAATCFQQDTQENTTKLHFDTAVAAQQQKQRKIDDNITHYKMYSKFNSYHNLLIDSGVSTHACPSNYATDLPLSFWRISSAALRRIKYVPCKQDNFMIPYNVCNVKCPVLSAPRLLDSGYGFYFNPRHFTIAHGQQQALLIRHSAFSTHDQQRLADLQDTTYIPRLQTMDNGKPSGCTSSVEWCRRPSSTTAASKPREEL